jgi:hypothetical protein
MAGKPVEPDPAGRAEASGPAGGEPPRGDERYGPLRLLRASKDDGRSLILYSDAARPGDGDGADAAPRGAAQRRR